MLETGETRPSEESASAKRKLPDPSMTGPRTRSERSQVSGIPAAGNLEAYVEYGIKPGAYTGKTSESGALVVQLVIV